jgi:hypothetical protein
MEIPGRTLTNFRVAEAPHTAARFSRESVGALRISIEKRWNLGSLGALGNGDG